MRSSSSYDSTVVEDHSVSKPVREPIVTRSSSGSERVNPDSPDRVIQESPDMFASSTRVLQVNNPNEMLDVDLS